MTEHELRELEVRISRYRFLKRETTDPLAECLLDGIVTELEADLKLNDTAANRRSIPVRMSTETTNSHTGTICSFFTLPMAASAAATGGEYHED